MNENVDSLSQDLRELHEVLQELNRNQSKQSNLFWNFWRGVVYGFGVFIGSAILATLLIYLVTSLGFNNDSVIGHFIQSIIDTASRN